MKLKSENLFFTSDTHFFHENIIEYIGRPFTSLEEMHETIILNWNTFVKKDSDVFHLGDFMMSENVNKLQSILSRLNGNIHLIYGNHDYQNHLNRNIAKQLFKSVHDYLDITVLDKEMEGGRQRVFMCHYPMNCWAASHRGSWNLFGHIHTHPYLYNPKYNCNSLDVGVDAHNYTPLHYDQVKSLITKQNLIKSNNEQIVVNIKDDIAYCNDPRVTFINLNNE